MIDKIKLSDKVYRDNNNIIIILSFTFRTIFRLLLFRGMAVLLLLSPS